MARGTVVGAKKPAGTTTAAAAPGRRHRPVVRFTTADGRR
jgi:hypothetical protein